MLTLNLSTTVFTCNMVTGSASCIQAGITFYRYKKNNNKKLFQKKRIIVLVIDEVINSN